MKTKDVFPRGTFHKPDTQEHYQLSIAYYDYDNQCWVVNGVIQCCGHPKEMNCNCYGRLHAGEKHTENNNCH